MYRINFSAFAGFAPFARLRQIRQDGRSFAYLACFAVAAKCIYLFAISPKPAILARSDGSFCQLQGNVNLQVNLIQ